MTDNEILKALMCCKKGDCCHFCPLFLKKSSKSCISDLNACSLDLIKRQQAEVAELRVLAEKNNDKLNSVIDCQEAEIERLTGYNSNLVFANQGVLYTLETEITKAKSEAITEFAERLKDYLNSDRFYDRVLKCLFDDIGNLVKEMTEATDEQRRT